MRQAAHIFQPDGESQDYELCQQAEEGASLSQDDGAAKDHKEIYWDKEFAHATH